jgi:3-deoxy-manno-octulosonate cytidylyltransferase (CMP-KDO synthetase)
VKVVTDGQGYALYFSRALIPFAREAGSGNVAPQLHIGIYAYRRRFLLQYAGWPVSRLERTEKLEQLRVLERGEKILVLEAAAAWHGIDTAEQYAQFVQRVRARGLGGAGGPAGH